jgi:hypothetical protein
MNVVHPDLFRSIHAYVAHLQNRAEGAVSTSERRTIAPNALMILVSWFLFGAR